ncbi:MAG: MgtC/SapB family protein [bacterium]
MLDAGMMLDALAPATAQWWDAEAANVPWWRQLFPPAVVSLGIALGIGLLIGLERERHPDTVAGVRTFGLAGLIGGLCAMISARGVTPWPLVIVASLAGAAGVWGGISARTAPAEGQTVRDIGLTTAFALVATTLLGGFAVLGERTVTIVAAGVLFLILYLRDPLHAMVRRLGKEDVRAIATFVLITLVILPVLPDREIGPFDAINPRTAWMLVVLVVSLSLVGYIAQAFLGARAGTVASGLLGGLVSSTAATVGASRRAREEGSTAAAAATALLACGVLPARLLVLIGLVSPALFERAGWWLGAIAAVTLFGGWLALRADGRDSQTQQAKPRNPTQLRSALAFAGAFVLIRIVTKATIEYGGTSMFLVAAGAAGITDMDAIAVSTAHEVTDKSIAAELGTRAVLVALFVNTVFKLIVTRAVGNAALFRTALPTLLAAALIAAAGVFFA